MADSQAHFPMLNPQPEIYNLKIEKSQGNHGACRANYRCCIPALAGLVSPHSMGPGKIDCNLNHEDGPIKKFCHPGTAGP